MGWQMTGNGNSVPGPLPLTAEQRADARAAQKAHWKEALALARELYGEAKAAGTLIPSEEIDRTLDAVRGRGPC